MCFIRASVQIDEVSLFQRCPYFRGVLISEVSFKRGSTVSHIQNQLSSQTTLYYLYHITMNFFTMGLPADDSGFCPVVACGVESNLDYQSTYTFLHVQ